MKLALLIILGIAGVTSVIVLLLIFIPVIAAFIYVLFGIGKDLMRWEP